MRFFFKNSIVNIWAHVWVLDSTRLYRALYPVERAVFPVHGEGFTQDERFGLLGSDISFMNSVEEMFVNFYEFKHHLTLNKVDYFKQKAKKGGTYLDSSVRG